MVRFAARSTLFFTGLLLMAGHAFAMGEGRPGEARLQAVEKAYQERQYPKVVELAGLSLEKEKDTGNKVRLHYLLGKSLYEVTAADVKSCLDAGTLKKGYMNKDQSDAMKKAQANFQAVYELSPSSAMAPESLFMTGKILDIGCLNHFKEAVVQYELCYKMYPENEFGRQALARSEKIRPFLQEGAHGQTMPHGSPTP